MRTEPPLVRLIFAPMPRRWPGFAPSGGNMRCSITAGTLLTLRMPTLPKHTHGMQVDDSFLKLNDFHLPMEAKDSSHWQTGCMRVGSNWEFM